MTINEYLLQSLENTSSDTSPLLAQYNPTYNIQDGDTVDNSRIVDFDTPESIYSKKANKLVDEYDVSLATQKEMGLKSKGFLADILAKSNPEFTKIGTDVYDRPLLRNNDITDAMISQGYAVPTNRYDEKRQHLYRAAREKQLNLLGSNTEDMDNIRQAALDRESSDILDSFGRSIDAFQAGTIQAVGSLGDFVSDVAGAGLNELGATELAKDFDKWGETLKTDEYANKAAGYDSREADFRKAEALSELQRGNYVKAFKEGLTIAPEVIANSLPLIIETFIGGGKFKAVTKAPEIISGMGKMFNLLKANTGYAAVVGQTTNDQIQEFEQLHKRDVTNGEIVQMGLVNAITVGMDKFTFKQITGLAPDLKHIASTLTPDFKNQIVDKVAKTALSLTAASGTEGVQEYIQTWGEILNVKAGSIEKYAEVLKNKESQDEALLGGILGASAGGVMHAASLPINELVDRNPDTVNYIIDNAKERVNTIRDTVSNSSTPTTNPIDNTSTIPINDIDDINMQLQESSDEPNTIRDEDSIKQDLTSVIKTIQDGSYQNDLQKTYDTLNSLSNETFNDDIKNGISQVKQQYFKSLANQDIDTSTTNVDLGSEEYTKDLIEEIVLNTKDFSAEEKVIRDNNINKIATKNKISPEDLQAIMKLDYISTEEMAKTEHGVAYGEAGYRTYGKMLREAERTQNDVKAKEAESSLIRLQRTQQTKLNAIKDLETKTQEKLDKGENISGKQIGLYGNIGEIYINVKDNKISQGHQKLVDSIQATLTNINKELASSKSISQSESEQVSTNETTPSIPESNKAAERAPSTQETDVLAQRETNKQKAKEGVQKKTVVEVSYKGKPYYVSKQNKIMGGTTGIVFADDAFNNSDLAKKAKIEILDKATKEFEKITNKNVEPKKTKVIEETVEEQIESTSLITDEELKTVKEKLILSSNDVSLKNKIRISNSRINNSKKLFSLATLSSYARTNLSKAIKALQGATRYDVKWNQNTFDNVFAEAPALGYVYDKDGNINPEVALAMDITFSEYLAYNSKVFGYKTQKELAAILGKTEDFEINRKLQKFYNTYGMSQGIVADQLGTNTAKLLGITSSSTVDYRQYKRFITDLGNMAIYQQQVLGNVEVIKLDKTQYAGVLEGEANLYFVRMSESFRNLKTSEERFAALQKHKDKFLNLKSELELEATFSKGPTTEPVKVKPKTYKAKNNPIANVSAKAIHTLNKLTHRKWTRNKEIVDYVANNVDLMKEKMGWINTDNFIGSLDAKESQKGINLQIESSINHILNLELDEMYFDYFYSKNGRYMIDSNEVNPTSDAFHRFIVSPESHTAQLDKTNEDQMNSFYYALAQASGFKAEKKPKEALTIGKKFATKNWEDSLKDIADIDVDHIAHYLQAVYAVKAFQEAKGNKFTATISAEFDGKTSGFAIKLMQFPILKQMGKWLKRVGVLVQNETVSEKDLDVYQNLGTSIVTPVPRKGDNVFNSLIPLLPKNEVVGVVSDKIRTLFKQPFMEFNYGSGINTIKESLGYTIINPILDEIAKGKHTKLANALNKLVIKDKGETLVSLLQTKTTSRIKLKNGKDIHTYLRDMVKDTYGTQIATTLKKEFQPFIEINNLTNASFQLMYKEFIKQYKIGEAKFKGVITEQNRITIYRELIKEFPIIEGPLSDMFEEGIAIFDTGKEYKKGFAIKSKVTGEHTNSTINPIIREIEAAISAGAVIPIHFIDGAVMTEMMNLSYDMTYIHDAVMPGIINSKDAVTNYNKSWYEVNKNYSVFKALVDAVNRINTTSETVDVKNAAGRYIPITQEELLQKLTKINQSVQKGREKLFSMNMKVAQMPGELGSAYDLNEFSNLSPEQITKIKSIILTKDGKIKATFQKLYKDSGINIGDC